MSKTSIHLPHLQGLRALAISAVVLAHAEVPGFAGGFVGVDVFFVLSGFLISRMLIEEHAHSGRIALIPFFARRIKRLLPALLVVIAITTLAARFLLSPDEAGAMLRSTPFAASWTSNLYFAFREVDYFDELAVNDLFLHTWSLGVEEQFYLLWPFVIGAAMTVSSRVRLTTTLTMILLTGFALCVAWAQWAPTHAFYLTPARIWQFAAGALTAVVFDDRQGARDLPTPRLALWAGISAIVAATVLYDAHTPFPGVAALLPTLGAALIIAAGLTLRRSGRRNLLADARLQWLGDRSYSLYLWHWPVLVIGATIGITASANGTLTLLLIALLLATLSYGLVERPFWKGRLSHIPPRPALLTGALAALAAFAGSLQALQAPPPADRLAEVEGRIRSNVPQIYRMDCDAWIHHARVEPCVFGQAEAERSVVLIGDSIGVQWFSAIPELFPAPQWKVIVLTKSACPMVDEDVVYERIGGVFEVCSEWRTAAVAAIEAMRPEVVLIGSSPRAAFSEQQWIDGSRRILAPLSAAARHVVVLAGSPSLDFDGPGCIVRALRQDTPILEHCAGNTPSQSIMQVTDHLHAAVDGLPNVSILDPTPIVCPQDRCQPITNDGTPVFRDSQHLTDDFVRASVPQLRIALDRLGLHR